MPDFDRKTAADTRPGAAVQALGFVLLMAWALMAMPAWADARWTGFTSETFQHVATETTSDVRNPTALAQDRHGFLWIGSQSGLIRWDGYRFRAYRPDAGAEVAGALPDNDIRNLFVDASGRLWIATNTGGLARYDDASDNFTTYAAGPKGLSHVTVTSLADDGAGGLWVGTWGGVDHLDPRRGTLHKAVIKGLPSEKIGALLRDPAGVLWIGTAQGLARREGKRIVTIALPTTDGTVASVRNIYRDSTGRIWVGTRRHGAYIVDAKTMAATLVSGPGAGELPSEGVNTILEVRPGEIWLGTYSHGIVTVSIDGDGAMQMRRVARDARVANSLLFDQVWALLRDRSGLIWVATGGGLSRYAPEQGGFSVIAGDTGRAVDMSEAGALSMAEMPDGRVWMGLLRKGVDIVDPVSGRVHSLVADSAHPETALPQNYVWDFAAMGHDVYIATGQGLYRADNQGRTVRRVHIPGRDPNTYTVGLMREGNALWVAGNDGVWRYEPGVEPRHITGLTDDRARILAQTPDGAVWIGTENGLNRLGPDGRIEHILADQGAHGLSSAYVTTLMADAKGRLWVGTSGGGIDILTGRDAKGKPVFHRIGVRDGLPDANVDRFLTDRDGRIWVSTDSALAVVDPDSLQVRPIGRESGLSVFNYWVGSGTTTRNGELLFSGASAVVVVRPNMMEAWAYEPPLVISDIRIGREVKVAAPFNAASAETLIVAPGKTVAVEFAALDLSAPDRNRYRYRLEGFERDWNETDASHRVATYTNLPPGRYVLKIQGTNRDGVWSGKTLSVPVRVLPAWYQSWWFYLLVVATVVGAIAAVVQLRTGVLRGRQRQLEALVEARTAELMQSQTQLEQMAYFDSLTGLPNRRMFHEDMRKAMASARREKTGFSLLLIDLDRFKQVNDTLGHDAGDALLKEVAIRLRGVLRENDCVARLGGDEFAILLMGGPDMGDVDTVCGRIVRSFAAPVSFQAQRLHTSPSIGVAAFPDDGADEDGLYKSADIALYRAKAAGRNTWRHYTAEPEAVAG